MYCRILYVGMFCWFSCVGAWQDLRPYVKAYGPIVGGATVGGYAMYRLLKARDDAPFRASDKLLVRCGSSAPVSLLYDSHAVGKSTFEGYIETNSLSDHIESCLNNFDNVEQLIDVCIVRISKSKRVTFHVALLPWLANDCMRWCSEKFEKERLQEQITVLEQREKAFAEIQFPRDAVYNIDQNVLQMRRESFIDSIVALHKTWIEKGLPGFEIAWFDAWKNSDCVADNSFETSFIPYIRDPIAAAISEYNESRTTDDSHYKNQSYDKTFEAQWLLQKWHQHSCTQEALLKKIGITHMQLIGIINRLNTPYLVKDIVCISEDITTNPKGDIVASHTINETIQSNYGIQLPSSGKADAIVQKLPSNFFCIDDACRQ